MKKKDIAGTIASLIILLLAACIFWPQYSQTANIEYGVDRSVSFQQSQACSDEEVRTAFLQAKDSLILGLSAGKKYSVKFFTTEKARSEFDKTKFQLNEIQADEIVIFQAEKETYALIKIVGKGKIICGTANSAAVDGQVEYTRKEGFGTLNEPKISRGLLIIYEK